MGELLRRGYDAQLADRNTKGYDLVVGRSDGGDLKRIQVKTVRQAPWYVKATSYEGAALDQVTIYVLIGKEAAAQPVRYFIARNRELADQVHRPKWRQGQHDTAFMALKAVEQFEGRWEIVVT